jgi:hypothetical protein
MSIKCFWFFLLDGCDRFYGFSECHIELPKLIQVSLTKTPYSAFWRKLRETGEIGAKLRQSMARQFVLALNDIHAQGMLVCTVLTAFLSFVSLLFGLISYLLSTSGNLRI